MKIDIGFPREDETPTSLRERNVRILNLRKARAQFDKTGTTDVLLGTRFGVSVKDEGDFVQVRFGSRDLTPIGSFPSGVRAFKTREKAFEFVEHLQSQIIQRRAALGNYMPNEKSLPSVNRCAQGRCLDNLDCD